ncbi:MAG TPA: hypothetical protein VF765_26305 [Polyangiaceae bacterium]
MASPKASSPPSAPFAELVHGRQPPREPAGREHRHERPEDPADPHVRHAAQLGPPPGLAQAEMVGQAPVPAATGGPARASLEDLLPALVRRVAWSGDGRRGTVRLELGSGGLAGAELVVHAEDGHVRVHLRAPPGVDLGPLRERIAARLAKRGLSLETVE